MKPEIHSLERYRQSSQEQETFWRIFWCKFINIIFWKYVTEIVAYVTRFFLSNCWEKLSNFKINIIITWNGDSSSRRPSCKIKMLQSNSCPSVFSIWMAGVTLNEIHHIVSRIFSKNASTNFTWNQVCLFILVYC